MKKYILQILIFFSLNDSFSQSISPLESSELCPNVDFVFTVTVPGINPNVILL